MGLCCSCCSEENSNHAHGQTPLQPAASAAHAHTRSVPAYGRGNSIVQEQPIAIVDPKHVTMSINVNLSDTAQVAHRYSKIVRVFLSSTFGDMQDERQAIVDKTIPRIRLALSRRGLQFVPIDLRWGITEESSKSGKTVYLCLENVQNCQYFIGFLKGRYGWHQDPQKQIDTSLQQNIAISLRTGYHFLEQYPNRSVTEYEILLGAFVDENGHPRLKSTSTKFFFASQDLIKQAVDATPPESREANYATARLEELKSKIRSAGLHNAEYSDADHLSDAIYSSFMEMADRDYPKAVTKTWLEEERLHQQQYIESFHVGYVPSPKQAGFQGLCAYAASNTKEVLVVQGGSGSGKTALLANWIKQYAKSNPQEIIISYFVGASSASWKLENVFRYLYEELKARFDIKAKLDLSKTLTAATHTQSEERKDYLLNQKIKNWISTNRHMLTKKVVIVIDGLDDIKDDSKLAWLSLGASPSIRIILSAYSEKESTVRRFTSGSEQRVRSKFISVQEYDRNQKAAVINENLRIAGKDLSPVLKEGLITSENTDRPLYLLMVLQQLKESQNVVHEELGQALRGLLRCEDESALIIQLISRWSEQYPVGLTKQVLCCIFVSDDGCGLLENELRELVGVGTKISMRQWAEFLAVSSAILETSDDMVNFNTRAARYAVEEAYSLKNEDDELCYHEMLGDLFSRKDGSSSITADRRAREGLFHMSKTGNKEALVSMLTDPGVILETVSSGVIEEANELESLHEFHSRCWEMSGREDDAARLYMESLESYAQRDQPPTIELASCYTSVGIILLYGKHGDTRNTEAIEFFKLAIMLFEKATSDRNLDRKSMCYKHALAFHNMSIAYQSMKNYDEALSQARKALQIVQNVSTNSWTVVFYIGKMAEIYKKKGDFGQSLERYERVVSTLHQLYGDIRNHPDIADYILQIGKCLLKLGNPDEASAKFEEAYNAFKESLGDDSEEAAKALHLIGNSYLKAGDYRSAESYLQDDERCIKSMKLLVELYDKRCDKKDARKREDMKQEIQSIYDNLGRQDSDAESSDAGDHDEDSDEGSDEDDS